MSTWPWAPSRCLRLPRLLDPPPRALRWRLMLLLLLLPLACRCCPPRGAPPPQLCTLPLSVPLRLPPLLLPWLRLPTVSRLRGVLGPARCVALGCRACVRADAHARVVVGARVAFRSWCCWPGAARARERTRGARSATSSRVCRLVRPSTSRMRGAIWRSGPRLSARPRTHTPPSLCPVCVLR